jgi:hypothetical protein
VLPWRSRLARSRLPVWTLAWTSSLARHPTYTRPTTAGLMLILVLVPPSVATAVVTPAEEAVAMVALLVVNLTLTYTQIRPERKKLHLLPRTKPQIRHHYQQLPNNLPSTIRITKKTMGTSATTTTLSRLTLVVTVVVGGMATQDCLSWTWKTAYQ